MHNIHPQLIRSGPELFPPKQLVLVRALLPRVAPRSASFDVLGPETKKQQQPEDQERTRVIIWDFEDLDFVLFLKLRIMKVNKETRKKSKFCQLL